MSRCFYFFSLLLAVVSSNALANDPPQLNIEQRYMARVGELFNLNIAPTDSSGMVPGVYLVNPPEGSTFSDQGDGTRVFQWIPPAFASEQRTLEFVVIDPADSALRSTITTTLDIASGPVDARDSITLNIDFAPSTTVSIGTPVSFVVTPRSNDGVVPNLRLVTELPAAQFVDNFDGTRTFVWDNPTEGFHRIEFQASHPDISSQRRFESVDITVIQGGDSVDAPIFDPIEYAPEVSVDSIVSFDVGARSSAGVPWLSVQDRPAASFFTDNRDGCYTSSC